MNSGNVTAMPYQDDSDSLTRIKLHN